MHESPENRKNAAGGVPHKDRRGGIAWLTSSATRVLVALLVCSCALLSPLAPVAQAYAQDNALIELWDSLAGSNKAAETQGSSSVVSQALGDEGDADIKIAVLSDTHYYPVNFVSDCADYETYVGGDPKMLEESGSILDAALDMVREDDPDILIVSGDLTKDGEIQGHRDLAAKFQELEDETDTEVFVINGNHDIYNYLDACTFENGRKESAQTTTPDEFKKIYANFGYNGDFEAQYFTNPAPGEQAGGLSYAVDLGRFTIVAIDSGMYSPDAGTGYDTNEHITAGRVDEDLLPWVTERIKEADAEGDTVIGLMHHGLVPHFEGEEDILSEYVVEDWQNVATAFADAGMRYIFTGHMHANDIAEYTTVSGNHITDLETGSLSSWRSPLRTVTLTKGEPLGDGTARTHETFEVSSRGVTSIDFTDHTGATTHIDDFLAYTQQKLYPETLFNNMANGMLRPVLQEIGEQGLRPWLAENLPDVDIDALVLDAVPDLLEGGMDIELGTGIGRVHVEYRNGGIQLQPSGTAGLIGDMTITDAQILRLVDDVLDKIETRYIDNPDWLLGKVDEIVTKVSNYGLTSLDADEKTIYDLVFVILTGHYSGAENPPAWVADAVATIRQGDIFNTLINDLLNDLMPIVNDVLANTSIDTSIAFSGLWKTAIDAVTDDGNLKETLDTFGFDETAIRALIEGLINEYMSPSFLTGMGSLVGNICDSMLYDTNGADDVIGGEGRTITFDGTTEAPEPSVENGLLPTQVTMTLGPDSTTDRAVRWYTGTNVTEGVVQVATDESFGEGSIVAEVEATAQEVTKPKTQLNLGLVTTYGTQQATKYSATIQNLDENADYFYRVGDKEHGYWSDAIPFTTGAETDDADTFSFINVNDSQGMVESDYDVYLNTLEQAHQTFPDAAFTVHGGDFVDDGANEDYWTWALDDENNVAQGMAMAPAAGNHEAKSDVEGITDANPIISHFNLANVPQGQDLSTGVYYSFEYKNATFVVLNTNDLGADGGISQAQYDWAYQTLSAADTEWKIVLLHKSPYSNGPHQTDEDVVAIRGQMDALAASCDVDVVLSGHDHVYNRTPYLMRGETQTVTTETQTYQGTNYETAVNPNGTVFIIAGTCGVKNYVQDTTGGIPSQVALDLSVPVYTGFTIDGDHLYYQAYTVSGDSSTMVDSFAISKAEEETPAWQKVEEQIAALPEQSEVTTSDKAAIEAARAAYDALSAEDQQQVSNLDRLVAAERMLSLLESVSGKRTVTVSNHGDFTNAINDPSVGTIITQGTIEFDEGGLFDDGDREIYVRRDVVVRGSGELKYCRFHVENGATLVLAGSVYVNDTRTQGSFYDALNPVEVNAGGTLITQDEVSLRTEYGTGGSEEGVAVKLMGAGATAILGSSGTYWGSEAAVLSTASGTTLVINDGTFNAKNSNRVVIDTHGDATVNGGTISSMWISGTLRVNGGTFEHQDSASSNWTPLAVSGGNAYITGGTFETYGGRDGTASIKLENGARLHVLADTNGAVRIGSVNAYVGNPSTDNYRDVRIGYAKANGWSGSDGIYRVEGTVSASSVEDIAALSASRLTTSDVSDNGSYMTTTLPDGASTVFGKYWLYGNGKGAPSGSGIIGSGEVIVYGPARTIQNNPVTGVTIDGDETRLVDLNQDGADTLRLNGYTTPANAFDNGITWSSDNEQTASVEERNGQGVVTIKQAGGANIKAVSDSKPTLSDSVEVIAVRPTLEGPETLDEETSTAIYTAGKGFESASYDSRLSFQYSVNDQTLATIDAKTGELAKLKPGTVTVTATLCLDGEPTAITVTKDVVLKAVPEAPEADVVNGLIDVQVSDANTDMAATHTAQTFETLIDNTEGEKDSYTIGDVYSEDAAASNPIEGITNFLGITRAAKIYKVDVTIQAAPYVAAFDTKLGLAAGTHTVEGDTSKTVTLVWSDGDPVAEPAVDAGWTLEDPESTPITFQGVCKSPEVVTVAPAEGNTAYTYDGSAKTFGFTVSPEGVAAESFKVEYRAADAAESDPWSSEAPVNAGTYDVHVTRADDGAYAAFDQTFENGLVIAKAACATPHIRYTEGETAGSITVLLQNGDSDYYYWSASADKSNSTKIEDGAFEVSAAGTYYIWGAGDENHEDSDLATATIYQVTFDDNDGVEGADETEDATFTKGANTALVPNKQALNSWGGLPTVEWAEHNFVQWVDAEGKAFTSLRSITDNMTVTAQWSVDGETATPVAPTAEGVAAMLANQLSVELHGVNELHNEDEGDDSHPDVTFGNGGTAQLPAEAFEAAAPMPVDGQDGVYTMTVTMNARAFLDAYAQMANSEGGEPYGEHYLAEADAQDEVTLTLELDTTALAEGEQPAWTLSEGTPASYTFDITCLTLRPAEAEIYTGGGSETGGHFVDQYVIDGQGNAYTIEALNDLLDEDTTASIKYYTEDGAEITDDTRPGHYIARIDIEESRGFSLLDDGVDESLEVTVNGNAYTYALEPSELIIRCVSDSAEAERGDLNVGLVSSTDTEAIKAALANAAGGVVASLPANTTIYFNGNVELPLAGTTGVTLLSDDLLPGQRESELIAHAKEQAQITIGDTYDFQYLDLVDKNQSNAWVSSSAGTTVYWRIPEGIDPATVAVYHFTGLHRDYTASDEKVSDLIAKSVVEKMQLTPGDGYVSFTVPASGFSPYLMVWNASGTVDPEPTPQTATVTFDANGGAFANGASTQTVSVTLTDGVDTVMAPSTNPTYEGHTFDGWYTDQAGKSAYDFTADVTASMTLYAKWTPAATPDPDPTPTPDPTPVPPVRKPTVTIEPAEGGSATVSDRYAEEGEEVSITTKPEADGLVYQITVADADGNTVHVHYDGVNAYSFTMPEGEATVVVEYRAPEAHASFADVDSAAWYAPTVNRITSLGFMQGYGDGETFGPADPVNRAMMAAIIWNVCGRPSVDEGTVATFVDADQDAFYAEALAWCEAEGAIAGYGDGTYYGPTDPISREQLAAMLLRISGDQDTSGTRIDSFADADQVSAFAEDAMRWAVEQGIINGFQPENLLRPTSHASRAEVAAMVLNWWDKVATK